MVNEFVYCSRLFHLEWVQSRFTSNDDVEQGLYVHRVVDEPGGVLPDAADISAEVLEGRTSAVCLANLSPTEGVGQDRSR
jgi:CRISPR-associated protein Cas1